MNTKSIAIAIALVAGTAFASSVQASEIVTLETVQVRPSAEQLVQAEHERNSNIPTLATVQVRPTVGPTVGQIVELMAEQVATRLAAHTPVAIGASIGQGIMLPAISVRPGLRQVQAKAADIAAEAAAKVVVQGLPSR
jgi:hypothetical protein